MYRVSIHVQHVAKDANRSRVFLGTDKLAIAQRLRDWLALVFPEIDAEPGKTDTETV